MSAVAAPPSTLPLRNAARQFVAEYGRKILAVSGFVMLGFVLLHLAGNLLAFSGSATFNAYARSIRELGAPLVGQGTLLLVARVVLAAAITFHLLAHLLIQWQPSSVSTTDDPLPPWFASLPVSVLQASGGVIALFVGFHILQLTIGATHPAFVRDDPYHNLVVALRFWPVAMAYIAAAAAVGVHLLPGFWTGMASLGVIRPRTERLVGRVSPVIALVVAVGLAVVPAAVLLGVVA